MASVAKNGSHTNDVGANDINYQIYNPNQTYHPQTCQGADDEFGNPTFYDCSFYTGGYDSYSGGSTTIHGTVVASCKMKVNGVSVAKVGDSVTETETTSLPAGATNITNDEGGTGHITTGSSKVFISGVAVAKVGSTVQTHTTPTTTIADGDIKINL
jgi:uncharacterized Zn-binding protein involved in type VI secretion